MRVMLDTNILISAIVFNSKLMWNVIKRIEEKGSIVLSSYVIDELHEVINGKFPTKAGALEQFLIELPFELIYTPKILPNHEIFTIRDKDDEKVLYSAVISDVDILVTGDKDFFEIEIERPDIVSHLEFLQKY